MVKPANVACLIIYITVVSYDRVLTISADLGDNKSELYKSKGVVCPRQQLHITI